MEHKHKMYYLRGIRLWGVLTECVESIEVNAYGKFEKKKEVPTHSWALRAVHQVMIDRRVRRPTVRRNS